MHISNMFVYQIWHVKLWKYSLHKTVCHFHRHSIYADNSIENIFRTGRSQSECYGHSIANNKVNMDSTGAEDY